MKNVRFIASLLSLCALVAGCSSEYQEIKTSNNFRAACENSKGFYDKSDGRCICMDINCKENDNCKVRCDEGVVCNMTTQKCATDIPTGVCNEKLDTCINSYLYKCINNKWEINDTEIMDGKCEHGCLSDNKGCADCSDDVCKDGKLYKCNQYKKLDDGIKCKTGRCNETNTMCYIECDEEGKIVCKDGNLKICQNDVYKEYESCRFGCEIDDDGGIRNSCAKGCKAGVKLCSDGEIKECIDGEFNEGEKCKDGNSCKNSTECGDCINGDVHCINDKNMIGQIQTCLNGLWVDVKECANTYSCHNNECGKCNDNIAVVCNNNSNNNGKLKNCNNGQIVENICPNSNSCSENECGECIDGTEICIDSDDSDKGGAAYICISGKYQPKQACTDENNNSASCKNEKECGKCKNETVICKNNSEDYYGIKKIDVGHIYECQNGKFEEIDKDKCIQNSCNADNSDCGECTNGNQKCNSKTIEKCVNGKYIKTNDCNNECKYDTNQIPYCT